MELDYPSLDRIFHPRAIAVCGRITDPYKWILREYFFDPFRQAGFGGQLYLVDAAGGHLDGYPVFPSLSDLPESPDYVICCVAAAKIPDLMKQCRDLGVKTVHIFTAGLSEIGEEEAASLQDEILTIACSGGMRVLGPNCMGPYYPAGGLSFSCSFPTEPGSVGLICQSGGHTTYTIRLAADRGLRFSKAVSYGNACDVNECDLLEYLAADKDTKVIAAYIEGTRDGSRFSEVLARTAAVKPVVIFKGGYTEGGGRATASHTSSLAGADAVWDGLLRQAGAIRVYSIEEMVDMLVALLHMKPPSGNSVCAAGFGGGSSVLATDECERAGLHMVPLPSETRDRLKSFIPAAGSMLRNPLDIGFLLVAQQDGTFNGKPVSDWEDKIREVVPLKGDRGWGDFLDIIEDWKDIDLVLFHYSVDINPICMTEWRMGTAIGLMLAGMKACNLPKAMVIQMMVGKPAYSAIERVYRLYTEARLPVFTSMSGAARAIRRLIDFNREQPELARSLQEGNVPGNLRLAAQSASISSQQDVIVEIQGGAE